MVKSTYLSPAIRDRGRVPKISQAIEFPKAFTIWGSLGLATWIGLDALAFFQISLAAGLSFLLASLVGVYGILKFLGCLRPCYNCKKCTYGMGRLSALYFGERNLKDYKLTYGLGVALFFYTFIGPLPSVILLISTVQSFAAVKAVILLCLLAPLFLSSMSWRKT